MYKGAFYFMFSNYCFILNIQDFIQSVSLKIIRTLNHYSYSLKSLMESFSMCVILWLQAGHCVIFEHFFESGFLCPFGQ